VVSVTDHALDYFLHGRHPPLSDGDHHITVQENDLRVLKDAEIGAFTLYHWLRMLSSQISRIMTYEPLLHSLTISFGRYRPCPGHWRHDGLDGCTHRHARQNHHPHPGYRSLHYAFLDDRNGLDGPVQKPDLRGNPGILEFMTGTAPPDWLAYGPIPIIVSSGLHYYTFSSCLSPPPYFPSTHPLKKPAS
jgi:iron(III) transport system permease protein